jgi:predicted CXXCH cytochrome family protein
VKEPICSKGRNSCILVTAGLVLIALCWGWPATVEAAKSPSCVTASCHDQMGKAKFVHGPAAVGECLYCHQQTGKHEFKAIKDVGELCYQCHIRQDDGKGVHPPVMDGECTGCHDAHQSPNQFQLRAAGDNLCFLCHDKSELIDNRFVHSPVAEGGCSSCHNPHKSDFPKMLIAEGNDVCYACHSDKEELAKTKKHTHGPVAESCVNCHSPHSTNYESNLVGEPNQGLCYICHDDKQEEIKNDKVKHAGLETPQKCLACHDPHFSDYVKQLVQKPMDLCMMCHSKEYVRGKNKTANMAEILSNNKSMHGPILENDCSGCHDPHGSNNFRILRANFPPVFYSPYNPENYELCFMCHEKNLASTQNTIVMTGFRNGNQNLHFVHVNKEVKGRTCRSCHDAHATNNPRHIRDTVPFGNWGLPVGYTKTETGGACLPGCHQLFEYDRDKPVKTR